MPKIVKSNLSSSTFKPKVKDYSYELNESGSKNVNESSSSYEDINYDLTDENFNIYDNQSEGHIDSAIIRSNNNDESGARIFDEVTSNVEAFSKEYYVEKYRAETILPIEAEEKPFVKIHNVEKYRVSSSYE